MRNIDLKKEKQKIINFIKTYFKDAGFSKGIIGLSGGIDSSLVAFLAVEALGKENVIGVLMPYKTSSKDSFDDGKLIAETLGIKYIIREITPIVDVYFDNYDPNADQLRKGNMKARARMCTLYDLAAKEHALVLGTSNKTELYLGYITQFGDAACALEPLGCFYKTEVWKLAKMMEVPENIIKKIPTADLWEGQTDEKEIGISYTDADEIIFALYEEKASIEELLSQGFTQEKIQHIISIVNTNRFKQSVPPNPETYTF
ncbi:MAG: NAD+ synthase [Candidatus Celaenobacter polaris]|nr:NAD+ synthase [Candidatus Celaenobacter polaris]